MSKTKAAPRKSTKSTKSTGKSAGRSSSRKGRASSGEKELRASLAAVTAQLRKTEKKLTKATEGAQQWKAEAKTHRAAVTKAEARVAKLQRKLERATAGSTPGDQDAGAGAETPYDAPAVVEDTTAEVDGHEVPDETWTVVRLRAEARARGLTGLSNKPKSEIIAALS